MAEDFVDHRRIFRCQPTPSSGDDLQGTAAAAQKAADFITRQERISREGELIWPKLYHTEVY